MRQAETRKAAVACALVLACAVSTGHAETAYITEQLIVGVTSLRDGEGERLASIRSGDKVDVIERDEEQAHVRLADGQEGWMKSSYLSSDPPLQQRLRESTSQVERLNREIARLQGEINASRAATAALASGQPPVNPNVSAPPPPEPEDPEPALPAPVNARFFDPQLQLVDRPAWHWALGSSAVTLVVGFVLGWRMLDRRIRRKYGGLRIY